MEVVGGFPNQPWFPRDSWMETAISQRKSWRYMDVEPKIGVVFPPKWMVKIMENPTKMDDLGVPLFLETPIWEFSLMCIKS